jgi:pyruvate kinase
LLLSDGRIKTIVTSVTNGIVRAEPQNDGILLQRKGINLPDTDFEGDTITKKDREILAWASGQDIDFIAQSFVQTAADIHAMRRIMRTLGLKAKIIAKFETKSAVENIEEIVDETDAIMIARGDLAVEVPKESVPVIQRKLVGLGIAHAKPTIVATQMMYSMVDEPEPTRAEVSDVATAVFIGADCVMLSDETAAGKHPIEAVKTMKNIILYSQNNAPLKALYPTVEIFNKRQSAICNSVINLAASIDAVAIVAETKSGATAMQLAARRPDRPIIVVTSDEKVSNQMALIYGTKSYVREDEPKQAAKLANWLHKNKILKKGDIIVTASGMYPGVVGTTDTIKVRVIE